VIDDTNSFVNLFDDTCRKSSLIDHFGWQDGDLIDTPEFAVTLRAGRPWMYDRTSKRLLGVYSAHSVVAGLLYEAYKGKDHVSKMRGYQVMGDHYVEEGMGFWLSSLSTLSRKIYVNEGFKLSASEKSAFRFYQFEVT